MKKLIKVDLLIIDEWLLLELSKEEATLLLEIINSRYTAKKSNIFCSQFDLQGWYEKLGDGTLAEAILDRIIHNSYDIFIDGTVSMREKLGINAMEIKNYFMRKSRHEQDCKFLFMPFSHCW